MKKIILVALVLLGLFFLIPNSNSKKRELIKELSPLACDLNQTECVVNYKGKDISFNIEPKPLKVLEESKIIIKNLDEIKDLNARLYGLNMYMGDIVGEFERIDNEYLANIVFSTCAENTMRYRLELFSKDKSLGLFIDFDVRR